MHYLSIFYLFILFAKSMQSRLGTTQKNVICKNNKIHNICHQCVSFNILLLSKIQSLFSFSLSYPPLPSQAQVKKLCFCQDSSLHVLLDSVLSCLPWSCSLNPVLSFLTLKGPLPPADKYLLMIPLYKVSLTLSLPEALVELLACHPCRFSLRSVPSRAVRWRGTGTEFWAYITYLTITLIWGNLLFPKLNALFGKWGWWCM